MLMTSQGHLSFKGILCELWLWVRGAGSAAGAYTLYPDDP